MYLPAYSTFLSLMKLPVMSDEELDEAIQFEAGKYIPIPLSEVTLGWSRSDNEVLLIAVPKTLSQRYVEIASSASLHLKALESETFSLVRALASEEKGNVLLLDIGAASSNITLVKDGSIYVQGTDPISNITALTDFESESYRIQIEANTEAVIYLKITMQLPAILELNLLGEP